jgi:signal transduction histidine kinase
VRIRVRYGDEQIDLFVSDDGRGFDLRPLGSRERTAWGLLGIEERATLLGGTAAVRSQPGEGTEVHVSVPYSDSPQGSNDQPPAPG